MLRNIFFAILSLSLAAILSSGYYGYELPFGAGLDLPTFQFGSGVFFLILSLAFLYDALFTKPLLSKTSTESLANPPDSGKLEVINFLYLLQEKGRLLDFAMDDIAKYSDEEVGRVARVVHQGTREVLDETLQIEPLHQGTDGDTVDIGDGDDLSIYTLLGIGTKKPPFSAKVLHRGWKAKRILLPDSIRKTKNLDGIMIKAVEMEVK